MFGLRFLDLFNRDTFFQENFHEGELCNYNPDFYLFKDVKKLAEKQNIKIEYIGPNTYPDLREHTGPFAFMIVGGLKPPPVIDSALFEVKELFWS